ncbi:hypothetical protein [Limnoglobus roseus]|uniref:Uncharacterized protein n=1 Tax=Limnoglobus roseus TaxID=2598579 RepID=A0A5C1A4U8_9BACT|nr:hypothetical protein [Limnoglobus roseus]QEL13427.1 hypothetical protein PX52LOC_00282 [Limnoglobus roseus]
MKLPRKRRTLVIILLCFFAVCLSQCLVGWPNLMPGRVKLPRKELPDSIESNTERHPSGHFNGHTEQSIVERFGQPSTQWAGQYGHPELKVRLIFPDAVTFVYETPKGSLYLSFCQQDGQRVCFSSDWLPTGGFF